MGRRKTRPPRAEPAEGVGRTGIGGGMAEGALAMVSSPSTRSRLTCCSESSGSAGLRVSGPGQVNRPEPLVVANADGVETRIEQRLAIFAAQNHGNWKLPAHS